MWSYGIINKNGGEFRYCVKHYPAASEDYGINGGKISKLDIRNVQNNKIISHYDRGWDIKIDSKLEDILTEILKNIIKKFLFFEGFKPSFLFKKNKKKY